MIQRRMQATHPYTYKNEMKLIYLKKDTCLVDLQSQWDLTGLSKTVTLLTISYAQAARTLTHATVVSTLDL